MSTDVVDNHFNYVGLNAGFRHVRHDRSTEIRKAPVLDARAGIKSGLGFRPTGERAFAFTKDKVTLLITLPGLKQQQR